ncbi:MAG: efflux RND transporter permease subunit [Gammaproteobacteria bacterium]
MSWSRSFLSNHVLANLCFGLVLVIGVLTYIQMPRAKDPQLNLNWVNIISIFPGASAEDVERRITDPFEEAIQRSIKDLKFVSSTSREGVSNIIVRFDYIDEATYDKRINDLRREIQNTYTDRVPDEVDDPVFYEINSSNWFPTASIAITALGDDENLRRQAYNIRRDLERLSGIDQVNAVGLREPELCVEFYPAVLQGMGVTALDIADTAREYFRDISAGDIDTTSGKLLVRIAGTSADPSELAKMPIVTGDGVVSLDSVAKLSFASEEPDALVKFNGAPAVMMSVTKDFDANVLELVSRVNNYIDERNALAQKTGIKLFLVDDQTVSTKQAINLMQTNALLGLFLVLLVTWIFLGTRVSILTSIGIPFTLAGAFIVLNVLDMTVNNTVLLGVVIALGMIVDDAVVVVESIYRRLQRGQEVLTAALDGLREVIAPVTTSVLTTMAAFLPLALLPGILGEFMRVIPIVVTVALAVSLLEAYWMLPAHVVATRINLDKPSKVQRLRIAFTRWVIRRYTMILAKAFRFPKIAFLCMTLLMLSAVGVVAGGLIRVNFFQGDNIQLFYVNIEMPPGTNLEETSRKLVEIESVARSVIEPRQLRASVAYAGQLFTETDTLFGDTVGQVLVSLNPQLPGDKDVLSVADDVEEVVSRISGPSNISMLRLTDGPPTQRPINIKVRGNAYEEILDAVEYLEVFMREHPHIKNISNDYRRGNPELVIRHNGEAIKRSGLTPAIVNRAIALYVDGEVVSDFQYQGEEVRVRVKPLLAVKSDAENILRETLSLPDGRTVPIRELVFAELGLGTYNIRHHDFRRAVTVQADIDKSQIDTLAANNQVIEHWAKARQRFPNIDLDFSGELDDIEESLDAIVILFLLGLGLMYIILGTQFRSYWQPAMILLSVPLAFVGVVCGLLVTGDPLSLYTMYGMVALAGIAVNSAIVLISAANDRLALGMSSLHATFYAARRRVIPVFITSATTIAGLFSLAAGLFGRSMIWGPVATAIVWGLAFSSLLTLIFIPLLYYTSMRGKAHSRRQGNLGISPAAY